MPAASGLELDDGASGASDPLRDAEGLPPAEEEYGDEDSLPDES